MQITIKQKEIGYKPGLINYYLSKIMDVKITQRQFIAKNEWSDEPLEFFDDILKGESYDDLVEKRDTTILIQVILLNSYVIKREIVPKYLEEEKYKKELDIYIKEMLEEEGLLKITKNKFKVGKE